MTIQFELDEQQLRQLEEVAQRMNLTTSDLAKAVVIELIETPDPDFQLVAKRVLKKNAELYTRLSHR